jgi:hypothetical protein
MELDNISTGDSEDETDIYPLQYQEVDPSLLGTAVFIKNVQLDPGEQVLLYVHQPIQEGNSLPDSKFWLISFGATLALLMMVLFSLY